MRLKYSQEELVNALTQKTIDNLVSLELAKRAENINIKVKAEDSALALFLNMNLSRDSYQEFRNFDDGLSYLPSYKKIVEAKKRCYTESITTTSVGCKIEPQALVDKTTNRLFEMIPNNTKLGKYTLIWKAGMDSTSGFNKINQKTSETEIDESVIFTVAFVPLRLEDYEKKIIWENPSSSSVRFCRTVEFQYEKETTQTIKSKFLFYQRKTQLLEPTLMEEIEVNHIFKWTMLDGKVVNAITGSPSTGCHICKKSLKEMQNIENDFQPIEENLKLGTSVLHLWINILNNFLKIIYKIKFIDEIKQINNLKRGKYKTEEDKKLKSN